MQLTLQPKQGSVWTGPLRYATHTTAIILVISIVELALFSAYGSYIVHAHIDHTSYAYEYRHVQSASTATIVFHSGTMPLLSVVQALVCLALDLTSHISLLTGLVISVVFTSGWIVQAGI